MLNKPQGYVSTYKYLFSDVIFSFTMLNSPLTHKMHAKNYFSYSILPPLRALYAPTSEYLYCGATKKKQYQADSLAQ